ncbi:MAG: acyltransferase domain-containing protein [Oscillospiraceae bacterium]|nr:acyltransferase domain-containing protein [Oscillospiraceae bacterium]
MTDKEFLAYTKDFMNRIHLPEEAKTELMAVEERIFADETLNALFKKLKADLREGEIAVGDALGELSGIAESTGISEYTLHFIFLINCTDDLLEQYRSEGVSEKIFWGTMDDFRCKLLECHEVKGVWGTFVGTWFGGFLAFDRFALGRFQYEISAFSRDEYNKAGVSLKKNDPVYNFHIPSSGYPFGPEARLESYKKAYEFYGFKEKGGPIAFVCSSWLLYPEHKDFLPEKSNILSFMSDFDIIDSWDKEEFGDSWRVFGHYHTLPVEQWPEDTSLRRAFKKRLLDGKKTGGGYGVIVFDGEKITNR